MSPFHYITKHLSIACLLVCLSTLAACNKARNNELDNTDTDTQNQVSPLVGRWEQVRIVYDYSSEEFQDMDTPVSGTFYNFCEDGTCFLGETQEGTQTFSYVYEPSKMLIKVEGWSWDMHIEELSSTEMILSEDASDLSIIGSQGGLTITMYFQKRQW